MAHRAIRAPSVPPSLPHAAPCHALLRTPMPQRSAAPNVQAPAFQSVLGKILRAQNSSSARALQSDAAKAHLPAPAHVTRRSEFGQHLSPLPACVAISSAICPRTKATCNLKRRQKNTGHRFRGSQFSDRNGGCSKGPLHGMTIGKNNNGNPFFLTLQTFFSNPSLFFQPFILSI